MEKLFRWLLHLIAAVCLVICVGSMVCWSVWFFGGKISGAYGIIPHSTTIAFGADEVVLESERGERVLTAAEQKQGNAISLSGRQLPGFQTYVRRAMLFKLPPPTSTNGRSFTGSAKFTRVVRISYWLILAVSAVPPVIWLIVLRHERRRLRKRIENAQCLACGYDLRATPDRCPECGHIASAASITLTSSAFSQSNVI